MTQRLSTNIKGYTLLTLLYALRVMKIAVTLNYVLILVLVRLHAAGSSGHHVISRLHAAGSSCHHEVISSEGKTAFNTQH